MIVFYQSLSKNFSRICITLKKESENLQRERERENLYKLLFAIHEILIVALK